MPMMRQAFQHRSARVIATGRVVLSVFFALAIWLDPARSARADDAAFLLILGYTLFADAILLATWNRWWLEAQLSAPAHIVDLIVFTILVFLTEGYSSPFFTFFVFLVLSASIRWGWREALWTTAAVIALFLAAVFVASTIEPQGVEVTRVFSRAGNLLVLSLMIVWFGINRPRDREDLAEDRVVEELSPVPGPPARHAMQYVANRLGAGRIVFAWSDTEEPWLHVWDLRDGKLHTTRLGPEAFPKVVSESFADRPFLFDLPRHRVLFLQQGRRRSAVVDESVDPSFAAQFEIQVGLMIPIRTEGYQGQLFALDVPGLCSDDLKVAIGVGEAVSSAFARVALFVATEEAASTRARLRLARDLHDSVAQFFAGMALKLHAMTKALVGEPILRGELEELQRQLAEEQRDLRGLLAALRDSNANGSGAKLADSIRLLAGRLERQWGVRCELSLGSSIMEIPLKLHYEIEQLIREAVANAVRHGEAKLITITISEAHGSLVLEVADNGKGFPVEGEFADTVLRERGIAPRSLHERVHALGGTMTLASSRSRGSTLAVFLPTNEVTP